MESMNNSARKQAPFTHSREGTVTHFNPSFTTKNHIYFSKNSSLNLTTTSTSMENSYKSTGVSSPTRTEQCLSLAKGSPSSFFKSFALILAILVVGIGDLWAQNTVTLSGSGTWYVPAGVTSITVKCWGGGGGGGGSTANTNNGGSGGGSGGYTTLTINSLTAGTGFSFSSGAGGAGGAATAGVKGTDGGNSTFSCASPSVSLTANGGVGGYANLGTAGSGGAASGGTNTAGASGGVGAALGGAGGTNSAAGSGAGGVAKQNGAGNPGAAPGGGGGGGEKSSSNAGPGGAGGAGRITITYTDPYNCANAYTCSSYSTTSVSTSGATQNISNLTSGCSASNSYYGSTYLDCYYGMTVNLSIVTSTASTGISVYIDWNADGDFADAGERVAGTNAAWTSSTTWTGSFTVPSTATATLGWKRMRVAQDFNNQLPAACGSGVPGEIEDYNVKVSQAPPTITTTGTLSAFSACANVASSQQSFTVSGTILTDGIVVTPPTGFEISSTSGSGFSSSAITLSQTSGSVSSTIIYVRMAALASNPTTANITCTSTGATTKNVSASGTVSQPPSISTNPSNASVNSGANTTFTAAGSNTPTSYEWQVNTGSSWTTIANGAPYSNATTATLTITGATLAMNGYQYRASATNTCGTSSYSNPATLSVSLVYCTPGNTSCTGATISNLTFNTINNSSTCANANGNAWTIYPTSSATTSVEVGVTYSMSVTLASAGTTTAWIDYNNNGTFEAVEGVQLYVNLLTGSANFSIPLNAFIGNVRMRVRSRTTTSTNSITDACTTFASGETEDYTITILASVPPTITNVPSTSICGSGQTVVITGTNFLTTTAVSINGSAVQSYTINSSTQITAITASGNTSGAVSVTTAGGTATGGSVSIYTLPSISSQPTTPASICGGSGTSTTSITASNAASYLWYKNNVAISGSPYSGFTSNTLTITNPSATENNASLTCVVTGSGGCTVTSSAVLLTVGSIPSAPTASNVSICAGETANLVGTSAGNGINWYDAATGGSLVNTSILTSGANFSVSPASTTIYYAESATLVPGLTQTSVPFSYSGSIENWTVPNGVFSITVNAKGAQGGSNGGTGGLGASTQGTFAVTPGQVLSILVGQQPPNDLSYAAGGGGTYVANGSSYLTATPMIVAGGGGGSTSGTGQGGQVLNVTTTGDGGGPVPGTNGFGAASTSCGGGGGGFYTSGGNDNLVTPTTIGGSGFRQGGAGGTAVSYSTGGFGGGATPNYAGSCNMQAGAGGGYSGGSGQNSGTIRYTGYGGGSYNSGTSQTNTAAVNSGNGQVVITYNTPVAGCVSSSRTPVTVTVNPSPTASAGSALSAICGGQTSAAMGGSVTSPATGGTWSGGTGTWTNNNSPANATYTAATGESGTITLTLTTTGGTCTQVTATKSIVVNALPVVNAGNDVSICNGNSTTLAASSPITTYSLTTSGGSLPGEKWVNITTGMNGTGTVVWAQGDGTIGNASGLLTNQQISLSAYSGQTLYLNCYDQYDDDWDGSVYSLSLNGTVVINNGGLSPNDGLNTDAFSTWESTAAELETSESFVVPNITFTWTPSTALSATNIANPVANPTSTQTYLVTASLNGCTSASDNVVVTVDQPSAVGAVSADQTICAGGTPTDMTIASATGTIQWQRATNAAFTSGLTNVGTNSTTLLNTDAGVGTLNATRYYRAVVTNGVCTSITSNTITITVVADPVITNTSNSYTFCVAPTVDITSSSSGGTGLMSYLWQYNTTGTTFAIVADNTPAGVSYNYNSATQTNNTLSISNLPVGTYTYRFRQQTNTLGCLSNGANITVTIVADPAAPTATKSPNTSAACTGQTITLAGVTDNGGGTGTCNIQFCFSTNGGASYSAWSTTLPSFAASGTDNRIKLRKNCSGTGCDLSPETTYTWTVTPTNTISLSSANNTQTVCSGTAINSITYNTTGATGVSVTGLPSGVTASFSTDVITISGAPNVPAGGTFAYTVNMTGGCTLNQAAPTGTITVTPNVAVNAFSPNTSTRCQGAGAVTYTTTGSNSTGITYSLDATSLTGGNTINSSTGQVTYASGWSGTTTITASAAGCNGPATATHVVTITPTVGTPAAISVASGTEPTCQLTNGSTTTTYATTASNNTGFNWSVSPLGAGTINATSGVMTWANGFSGSATISVTANGCNGPSLSTTRMVTINASPATVAVNGAGAICSGASATLSAGNGSSGTIYWQNTTSGGTSTSTASASQSVNSAGTYYFRAQSAEGCWGTEGSATITINQPSINISVNNNQIGNGDYLWNGNTSSDGSEASNWYVLNNNVYSIASVAPTSSTEVFVINFNDASTCVSNTNSANIPASGSFTSGNIYLGSNASITLGSSSTLNVTGNFINDGTFTPGTGTVIMNGGTAQTIGGASATTFNNLTINNGAGVSLNRAVDVNGTLNLSNGVLSLGDNNLTLGTGGTISVTSPSASKMIATSGSGELRKRYAQAANQNPAAFLFPVGTTGAYTPVHLDFSNVTFGSDAYMRVRIEANKSSNLSSTLTSYLNRNWIVEPNDISNFIYDINLQYANGDFVNGGLTDDDIVPIKYSNGQWNQPAGLLEPFTNATNESSDYYAYGSFTNNVFNSSRVIKWGGLQTFSEFGGAGMSGQPLPVELLSFNGTCNEGMVDLLWQTASEFNSSHFDVEKSTDGETWRVLATIPSAGTSNELLTYQTVDNNGTSGSNYYRLRQVDIDGKEKLYDPINVSCVETTVGYFTSYPNPSGNEFQVIVNNKEILGACTLNIVDAQGKVIDQRKIEVKDGINMFVISETLTPGIYFLNITNGTKTTQVIKHAVK
jgi:hypothetical protein